MPTVVIAIGLAMLAVGCGRDASTSDGPTPQRRLDDHRRAVADDRDPRDGRHRVGASRGIPYPPDAEAVPAGDVEFTISNDGNSAHEFKVTRVGSAKPKLPTLEDGSVDEDLRPLLQPRGTATSWARNPTTGWG